MHCYIFNNESEVRYEDWLHYQKLAELDLDKRSNRAMDGVAVGLGAGFAGLVAGAVLTFGALPIILGCVAALFGSAAAVTVMARFGREDKSESYLNGLSKQQVKDLKDELKAMKRGGLWKEYDRIMRKYAVTAKYYKDRDEYKAQQKNQVEKEDETGKGLIAERVKAENDVNQKVYEAAIELANEQASSNNTTVDEDDEDGCNI